MEGWPYGSGGRGRGDAASTPTYIRYRQFLIDAGRMRLARYSPTKVAFGHGRRPPDDLSREASVYAVRVPRLDVCVRDVGIDALELESVAAESGLTMSGRPLGLDEAHHIVWIVREGIPVRRRYGYRLGVRIEHAARELRYGLGNG